jgi:hypothetical protein
MRLSTSLTLACILVSVPCVFGQDLNLLVPRVFQLWELRQRSDKVGALRLIDPPTHNIFLTANETPILSYKISGIEFTDDPAHVNVLVKVRSVIPNVGELDRIVREKWAWNAGQWVMQATPVQSFFDLDSEKKSTEPILPDFQLTDRLIDVGRHSQGDLVEGKVGFRANREDIRVIRPLQKIDGLIISAPVWTSPSEGYLPYQWETTLVSQNIDQTISLEAIATSDARVSAEIRFRARIDGRVGFKQVPEIVDPSKPGQVELEIQNLTAKPLKILSVVSHNSAYVVDENVSPSIDPGKSGRLLIRYVAQIQPTGASLALVLSESLTPSGLTTVPINVKLPDSKPSTYTQEELIKAFRPRTSAPALPPAPK